MARRSCARDALLLSLVAAAAAWAQEAPTPPRLLSAAVPPSPMNAQSGGIAAFDVAVDDAGSVASVDTVQDVAPFGDALRGAVRGWRFEPAREQGRAVRSRVLVLGFFRPPELAVIAPERPRYKDTTAPEELPWPTSVTVPPYPPNALGSGKVILEVEVSEEGKVASTRVLNPGSPFDGAAAGAAQAWTFRPASRNGRPVATRAYFVFTFVGTTP
jgi:TonB family protein